MYRVGFSSREQFDSHSNVSISVVIIMTVCIQQLHLPFVVLCGYTLEHLFAFAAHRQHFSCNNFGSATGSVNVVIK